MDLNKIKRYRHLSEVNKTKQRDKTLALMGEFISAGNDQEKIKKGFDVILQMYNYLILSGASREDFYEYILKLENN